MHFHSAHAFNNPKTKTPQNQHTILTHSFIPQTMRWIASPIEGCLLPFRSQRTAITQVPTSIKQNISFSTCNKTKIAVSL